MAKDASATRAQPLEGVRVLDLGTMIAGPIAATLFGDFGAEVVKVEVPERGDTVRDLGPFVDGECLYWQVEARNKKSITLNLREPRGQAILHDLVKQVDAVVENFRPGTLEKWNCGFEDLKRHNPKLVMLRVSGFGQTGPYRERAGYDRIGLAFGGLMGITGFADRPPVRSGTSTADYQSGLMGAAALMAALYRRDVLGGEGQEIDVAMYESVFRFTETLMPDYAYSGTVRPRGGHRHYSAVPGGLYTSDAGRELVVSVTDDHEFAALCTVMERRDLAANPDYFGHAGRSAHADLLEGALRDWIAATPEAAVIAALESARVPHAFVRTIGELFADPHVRDRGSIATVEHPRMGPVRMSGVVPRMTGTPIRAIDPAPALGEHNDEIYGDWLGYDAAQREALRADGIL